MNEFEFQVCRHYLVPQLQQVVLDQNLFDNSHQKSHSERTSNQSPKMPPPTVDATGNTQGPPTPKNDSGTSIPIVSLASSNLNYCSIVSNCKSKLLWIIATF
jgi:hypothetical protein